MSARGPLAGYRALDLTDHRGALAGRLLADLGVDPHHVGHSGFFVAVEHPVIGAAPIEGHAFRLPACPAEWRAALLWGQQTEEVFGELLGLPRSEIERLRAAEVLW